MSFNFKNFIKSTYILALILLLFIPLIYGCTAMTLNPTEETEETEENETKQLNNEEEENIKTEEELQKEKEEEQRREEERLAEERELREEALKEELGPYFVPLPPLEQEDNPPVKAKGLYLTGNSVGLRSRFENILEMVETTELNSLVIDVKNDHGRMTYPSEIEIVKEVEANRSAPVKDIHSVMEELKERDIYPIARIVVFRDNHLPDYRPDWAVQKKTGGIWEDYGGNAWLNPYNKEVWDYTIAIAKEAALAGFKEIQFDYVRFPENFQRVKREADFLGHNDVSKEDIIRDFLIYAGKQLEEYNVFISADTFGVIATSWGDVDNIGQNWEKIAPHVDYNCPMVYPSHYGPGYFGYDVPDAHPEGTIKHALTDALKRNAPIEEPGIIRPWLQGFSAGWIRGNIPYGAKEVRAQIDTALELGIDEFLIWNARNRYDSDSFLTEEEADKREEEMRKAREEKGKDFLGKTSKQALEDYFDAVGRKSWRDGFYLQATDYSMEHEDYREWVKDWTGTVISYEVVSSSYSEDKAVYELDLVFIIDGQEYELNKKICEVYQENNVWRVKPSEDIIDKFTFEPPPPPQEETEG